MFAQYLPEGAFEGEDFGGFIPWVESLPFKGQMKIIKPNFLGVLMVLGMLIRDSALGLCGEAEEYPEDLPDHLRYFDKTTKHFEELCGLCPKIEAWLPFIVPSDPLWKSIASGSGAGPAVIQTAPVGAPAPKAQGIRIRPTAKGPRQPVPAPQPEMPSAPSPPVSEQPVPPEPEQEVPPVPARPVTPVPEQPPTPPPEQNIQHRTPDRNTTPVQESVTPIAPVKKGKANPRAAPKRTRAETQAEKDEEEGEEDQPLAKRTRK